MASSNHRCSIECSPSDILARSITNSAQYTQLQCGRNPRSVLQNVYLVWTQNSVTDKVGGVTIHKQIENSGTGDAMLFQCRLPALRH